MAGRGPSRYGRRRRNPRNDRPDFTIFTDAGTATAIISAITFKRPEFLASQIIWGTRETAPGNYWQSYVDGSNAIYGLEAIAPLALLWIPRDHLRGKSPIFHIGNENTVKEPVEFNAKPTVIAPITR